MRKIGEYTARGQVTENESEAGTPNRIRLFDGRFDTGYRVRFFVVWGSSASSSSMPDCSGKLATSPNCQTAVDGFFDASDGREIAWSGTAGSTDTWFNSPPAVIIDEENFIVEDLYVYVRGAIDTTPINYLVVMDKYDTSESFGAVTMARDRAQDSGFVA